MSDWVEMELGRFIELKRGYDLPKKNRQEGAVPLVSSSGKSDFHSVAKIKGPGVVTGRYGTIGQVYYVEEDFWPLNTTLYVKDFKGNDSLFVYYFLKTISYSDYSDKAAVPGINRNHLHKAEIRVPVDSAYQRELVEKLWTLDSKIKLNRQTNQTLEQMAQAIFKSWFVDFEPVKAKIQAKNSSRDPEHAAMCAISGKSLEELEQLSVEAQQQLKSAAALFPEVLVESELGEIPEGWNVRTFGSVSQCFDSKRIPLSKKKREEKKPGEIPYYGATSIMDYINEWIFDDIYLLLGEDGSVIKEDGTPFVQYVWGKSWVNNHAHVLQGKNGVSTEQLMLFIQRQNITAYITGAVQLKLNQGNMNSIPFLDAGENINCAFYDFVKPFYEKIRMTVDENKALTELRDVLLPKLLSGKISITNTKTEMETTA